MGSQSDAARTLPRALPLGLGLLLCAAEARADKFDETLDVSLHGRASWFEADALGLSPAPAYDAPLLEKAAPRLTGTGRGYATVLRANLSIEGFRFGLGMGVMTVAGLTFEADEPLETGHLWGVPFEAFAGYAFGSGRDVRPYLELRGTLTALQLGLSTEDYGAPFNAYAPGLAARGGVLIPLSEYLFLDAGLGAGMVGPERFTLDVGLGLPIPLSNL
jgi:hypothetical protein